MLGKKKWFTDFFELLGIEQDRIVFIDKPTKLKKIIVPEESVHSWKEYYDEYLLPYDKMRSNVQKQEYKKIYLTRTSFEKNGGGYDCYNEECLENFFRDKGYKVIAPELLPISEQIGIMAGADDVVTTLGSISHLALFCEKGTNFTILNRVDDDTLLPQCLINQASGVNWCFVDVSLNFLSANRTYGVNLLGVTKYFKAYVAAKFGENCIVNDTIETSCYSYLLKWCEYYSNPVNFKKIKNQNMFDVLNRMHRILLESELDRKEYEIGLTNDELHKKWMETERKLRIERGNAARLKRKLDIQTELLGKLKQTFEYMWNRDVISYCAHIQNRGWLEERLEGEICGEINSQLQIEAIRVKFISGIFKVFYSVYIETYGWSDEAVDGEVAGTVGKSLPLRSIRMRLDDELITDYDIMYRIYNHKEGWSAWTYNGENTDTFGWNEFNAIEIKIEPKSIVFQDIF